MGIEVTKFWEIESNKKTNRFIFISSGNPSGKYYILEQQRERTLVKEQIYSDTDNLKFLKLEGAFKDNAGNFGEVSCINIEHYYIKSSSWIANNKYTRLGFKWKN